MNPWAFIVIALGVLLIVMGIKGTQHQVTSALVGHKTGSTTTPPSTAPGTAGAGSPRIVA